MKSKLPVVLLTSLATLFATQTAFATGSKDWIIKGTGSNIYEGRRYDMLSVDQNAYLKYQDRTGANFGWSNYLGGYMQIKRQYPSSAPLKCGETFALFVDKEWAIYEKQTYGINLSSRTRLTDPRWYQWRFANCGGYGTPISLNQRVTLVNNVANDAVVGCKRVAGVNLCWGKTVVYPVYPLPNAGKHYYNQGLSFPTVPMPWDWI